MYVLQYAILECTRVHRVPVSHAYMVTSVFVFFIFYRYLGKYQVLQYTYSEYRRTGSMLFNS